MKRRSKIKGDPPALILGGGMTALGALRALAEKGRTCFVAASDTFLVGDSRWYRPAPCSERFEESAATPDSIRQIDLDAAVLIPCSDSTALAVARLNAQKPANLYSCTNSEDTLLLFQDKQRFAKLLTKLDVPHPLTFVIGDESDFDLLDFTKLSGVFLKPADSQSFIAHYGVKAFWVDGKTAAVERWRAAHENGLETVLQEYVAGDASDHYYIDGFVDSSGQVRGQFGRRRLRIFPPDFGNSTLLVSIPLSDIGPAADSLAKVLEATEYRGIFSAEFKQDTTTGVFKVIEINTRAWWYVDFARRCGIDVCNMAYDDALGRPVEVATDYATGKRCAYPHQDYRAYREARKTAPTSFISWVRPWFGALQPILRLTDPMPMIKATLDLLGRMVGRRLHGKSGFQNNSR